MNLWNQNIEKIVPINSYSQVTLKDYCDFRDVIELHHPEFQHFFKWQDQQGLWIEWAQVNLPHLKSSTLTQRFSCIRDLGLNEISIEELHIFKNQNENITQYYPGAFFHNYLCQYHSLPMDDIPKFIKCIFVVGQALLNCREGRIQCINEILTFGLTNKESAAGAIYQTGYYMGHYLQFFRNNAPTELYKAYFFKNYCSAIDKEEPHLFNVLQISAKSDIENKIKVPSKRTSVSQNNAKIPRPSPGEVREHLEHWKTLDNYRLQEDALNLLFHKLCPTNTRIEEILLKVSSLNDFYSTHIFNTFEVSKHILDCNIDKALEEGKESVINKISRVRIKDKEINFFSFATKYCNHHNPEAYPIYDNYVEKMLWHFKKVDSFYQFRKEDLKIYSKFKKMIINFKEFYHLKEFSIREIDIYLWLAGKKFFPRKYKN